MTSLAERLRAQSAQCADHHSPLTAALLTGAADDYEAGGPARDLLAPLAGDPSGTVPSLRFAGALHRMVLQREAPELALHYPSVGGTAPVDQVWPAARKHIAEALPALREHVRRPVQTNEPGRSAVLLGGLHHVASGTEKPLRLLEIGASAGLNLLVDRYAYELTSGQVLGDPGSPMRLVQPWRGDLPASSFEIVERLGCDPRPLDPRSTADRLTLTSYVWGDQLERFDRLRNALEVAAQHPVTVRPAGASDFLAAELAGPRADVATVVWQSVVQQYLDPLERIAVEELLQAAGSRATAQAPLAHLMMEPDPSARPGAAFRVTLRTWPGGESRILATCRGHGPPITWH
ncbi:MAG: DUF2332 domain-containing protein [Mycobacteriales bacterium]